MKPEDIQHEQTQRNLLYVLRREGYEDVNEKPSEDPNFTDLAKPSKTMTITYDWSRDEIDVSYDHTGDNLNDPGFFLGARSIKHASKDIYKTLFIISRLEKLTNHIDTYIKTID